MASSRALTILLATTVALALLVSRYRNGTTAELELLSLQGGELIAIRSLATEKYLTLSPTSGHVLATAETASSVASWWRVLVLDTDTVSAFMRSANVCFV